MSCVVPTSYRGLSNKRDKNNDRCIMSKEYIGSFKSEYFGLFVRII